MKLLTVIYYLGLIACGIQGSQKSHQLHNCFCLPASFLAALGGGMLRDLFILSVFPIALTKGCIPDIMIALFACIFHRIFLQKNAHYPSDNLAVTITDALGLGTFIAIGIDRALSFGTNNIIAFCCGVITALGGGILSSLLCGQSVHKILSTNVTYRVITILGAFIYICCVTNNIDPSIAQYCLIIYTLLFVTMANNKFRSIIKQYHYSLEIAFAIPTNALLYQPIRQCMYACPYYFHDLNKGLLCARYTVTVINPKLLCPRRFSRGR